MSATLHATSAALDGEAHITIELDLPEAEAIRAWLLKPAADGTTSLDDALVSRVLADLGRAVDAARATQAMRLELEDAGLDVGHLSDDQVLALARRLSDAAAAVPHD